MIYVADIVTASGVTQSEPDVFMLHITRGIVYQISVYIPPGCAGLCGVAVFDGNYQIWPTNPEVYFTGDNVYISFPDSYFKLTPPYIFTIKTYNIDETYSHSVKIHIGILSEQEYINRYMPGVSLNDAINTITNLLNQQESQKEEVDLLEQPFPNYSEE